MLKAALTLTAALAAAALAAQQAAPADAVREAHRAMNRGRYLEAVDGFAAAAFDAKGAVRDRSAFETWTQFSPFVTNELDLATLDRAEGEEVAPDPERDRRVAAARPRDALVEIVRRARATSVVILNEAHHSPRDRAFGLEVARALRPLGYSVLAAETFGQLDDDPAFFMDRLAREGVVRRFTGTYTKDPVFAGFVREAVALGYHPVAYEQTTAQSTPDGGIEEREQAQADNLKARVFDRDPNAKVLIFVGHSHVAEAPVARAGRVAEWMAARLKRMTGVDPLTIDQTGLTDLSRSTRAAHGRAAARIGRRPAVLFEGDRPLVVGPYAGAVDLQILHPRRAYAAGRPDWLAGMGREPAAIPADLLPTTGRRLIQAFAADAPEDAVPLDQVLVVAGARAPKLMLPPGRRVRYAVQP